VATPAQQIRRRLPGIAGRYPVSSSSNSGKIIFLKGVVISADRNYQVIQTDSKIYRLVRLLAATYLYTCDSCHSSVYEEEVTAQGKHACPFCAGPISPLTKGDKVRLHYRFAKDASWAEWWGERWEW
jgi:DNA-directed RNA polymerase subunit RPC12/RpoP